MDLTEALNKLNEDVDGIVSYEDVKKACEFANRFKQSVVDVKNKKIVIPYSPGMTEKEITSPGMMGAWFTEHGFNSEYEVRDFEYTTLSGFVTYTGIKPKKAYLRNRLVGTYTWQKEK